MFAPRLHSDLTLACGGWLLLALLGCVVLVRFDIAERREVFRTEARAVHRLLGQQAAQNDAVMDLLGLLQAERDGDNRRTERLGDDLSRRYPQIVAIARRVAGQAWPVDWPGLDVAEAASAASMVSAASATSFSSSGAPSTSAMPPSAMPSGAMPSGALPHGASAGDHAPAMADFDPVTGRYSLVLAGDPVSHALRIDARRLVAQAQWPLRAAGPFEVRLLSAGLGPLMDSGPADAERPFGLTQGFVFEEAIDSASQPLTLLIRHATGPGAWPWRQLAAWVAVSAMLAATLLSVVRVRQARRQAREAARLARVARLDSLGELAAGIAHELNQPLAAVLASTQAALRVLPAATVAGAAGGAESKVGPEQDATLAAEDAALAHEALHLAASQARRASEVLNRMRRLVEPGRTDRAPGPVDLERLATAVLTLMAPELRQAQVRVRLSGRAPTAFADPVAIEQILHNLISNALQAMTRQPGLQAPPAGPADRAGDRRPMRRQIDIGLSGSGDRAMIAVRDHGPGLTPEVRARLFEPFFTTRADGLGLGLALCESLARGQGGELTVTVTEPGQGAEFVLALPRRAAGAPSTDRGPSA